MSHHWTGTRKVGFIPVSRPRIDAVPPDWESQIQRRIYFDPVTGVDLSLRTYIYVTSYGRADIEGVVLPRVEIDRADVAVNALADRTDSLRGQGFDAAALVMLGRSGAGSAEQAGFWARFVMEEGLGIWAMELTHVLTGYGDLYIDGVTESADEWFDNMACSCGTHPSAFTKESLGWLDSPTIARHAGGLGMYDLHTLALMQPPPSGRSAAVQVGSSHPLLMIEARERVDQFDGRIPSQGVIVYECLSSDEQPDEHLTRPVLLLRTRTALAPGTVYSAGSGVKVSVTGALVGGFSIRVDDPTPLVNRSAQFGTPPAAGPPTACVIPGHGVHNIAYRATSGRLHELWRDGRGATGTTDLTANANAPTAIGDPFFYVDTTRNMQILLFRSANGTVRSLYWSTGAVGHDNLSGTAGAPGASGDPVGYYTVASDTHHVIYRTGDGHLHALWWIGLAPVVYGGDLTKEASAPPAQGQPSAFVNGSGESIVVYRSGNAQIRSVYWSTGPFEHEDLSGFAGTPPPASDPVAYYTAHDDTQQIFYVGNDGHLWELSWTGHDPVVGRDLTEPSGAPPATGTPAGYYSAGTNTRHVIYRSSDGRLHEIRLVPGQTPTHVDLTTFAGAPPAADGPAGFSVEGAFNTRRAAYRGTDGHIYEVLW